MELYRQPVPFETVYHRKHPLSVPYDNFTVNIANKQVKYIVVFFSLKGDSTPVPTANVVTYAPPRDEPVYARCHDSVYLPCDVSVLINGKSYIESKQKAPER